MEISADARMAFPRDLVFATYRDRLPELVPYLPNMKAIEVIKREDAPGGAQGIAKLLNIWHAHGEIPKVAAAILKPEMLAWEDHALWNQNDWTCEWKVVPKFFTDKIDCGGKNRFVEQGGATTLQIRGHLEIKLEGVPGVPRFLAGTIAPVVEKFIVALITPNLTSVSKALESFLRAQPKP